MSTFKRIRASRLSSCNRNGSQNILPPLHKFGNFVAMIQKTIPGEESKLWRIDIFRFKSTLMPFLHHQLALVGIVKSSSHVVGSSKQYPMGLRYTSYCVLFCTMAARMMVCKWRLIFPDTGMPMTIAAKIAKTVGITDEGRTPKYRGSNFKTIGT